MKAICKTNITTNTIKFNLTIGKVYEVHRYSLAHKADPVWVYIVDDGGATEHYIEKMFTPLTEMRNIRLEELLK
jgi:hypothetical protein